MKEQMQDTTKMEFLMTLNDNIIVQRFYNVKGYNPKARRSLEVSYILKEIRPELKTILRGLTDIFSAENLSFKYMNYQLA